MEAFLDLYQRCPKKKNSSQNKILVTGLASAIAPVNLLISYLFHQLTEIAQRVQTGALFIYS